MNDNQIVDLYWKRQGTAISETEKKYGRYLFSIADHILAQYEDSEECVNDTYWGAWNSIPPYKPNALSYISRKDYTKTGAEKAAYEYRRKTRRNGSRPVPG